MVKLTNFDHLTTVILEFWPWSWSKMAIFDHLTTAILKFWPWSWSKIFDHLTMTPGRRSNGQKIVVIFPVAELQKVARDEKVSFGMATLHFVGKFESQVYYHFTKHYGIRTIILLYRRNFSPLLLSPKSKSYPGRGLNPLPRAFEASALDHWAMNL